MEDLIMEIQFTMHNGEKVFLKEVEGFESFKEFAERVNVVKYEGVFLYYGNQAINVEHVSSFKVTAQRYKNSSISNIKERVAEAKGYTKVTFGSADE